MFTPVFTDPKIVKKMGVVGNADLCVLWTRELEGNLEQALITHLQNFWLELGNGFTFVARQKRWLYLNHR